MHGAEATATYYTSPRLGFDFTFAVHNGNIVVPPGLDIPEGTPVSIYFRQVAFMAGPRISLTPPGAKVELAVRAALGASIGNAGRSRVCSRWTPTTRYWRSRRGPA